MYGAWKNYSCTGMRMCVHICTSMCTCECVTKGLYIDSKDKRTCNRVPIKRHSKGKNSNKFCTNYGIEAANVTKNTTVPFRSWFEFC